MDDPVQECRPCTAKAQHLVFLTRETERRQENRAERNERRHKNRPSAASLSRNQNQFSRQDARNAKKTGLR